MTSVTGSSSATGRSGPTEAFTVLLYSDDASVRERMRLAIGRRPAADVRVTFLDASTSDEVVAVVDNEDVDLLLLDGEAWPAGGLGIARQVKDEITDPPTCCVVLARAADRWLAAWSGADAVLVHPLDPVRTGEAVAELLRSQAERVAATP